MRRDATGTGRCDSADTFTFHMQSDHWIIGINRSSQLVFILMYSLTSSDKCWQSGSHNNRKDMMWSLMSVHIYIKFNGWFVQWDDINLAGFEQCLCFNAALQWELVTISVCVCVCPRYLCNSRWRCFYRQTWNRSTWRAHVLNTPQHILVNIQTFIVTPHLSGHTFSVVLTILCLITFLYQK